MESAYFKKTVANGNRLLLDSRALCRNGRILSAAGLAVLAMEELGKALIFAWGVKNSASKKSSPSHIEKQGAVFVLLAATELRRMSAAQLKTYFANDGSFSGIGPYSKQLHWAKAGFYHDIRMASTYSDEDPKIPDEILATLSTGFVEDLYGFYKTALSASKYKKTMKMAALIYNNDLGSL